MADFNFDNYMAQLMGNQPPLPPAPAPTKLPEPEAAAPLETSPIQQAQAAQAQEPVAQAPVAAATTGEFNLGDFMKNLGSDSASLPDAPSDTPGSSPFNAMDESPLSLMDRARLGWVRTKENQQKVLEANYGKDNVHLLDNGKESSFTVKDKDGLWKQVDPAMSWKTKGDIFGDVAQFAGEYGLRSAAAAYGGAAAGGAAAAAATPTGPYGMAAAGALGFMAGAGAAAGSAEGVDMLSRMAMPKDVIGSDVTPKNLEEAGHQLYASMLFGMEQEVGGKVLHFGGSKAIEATAGAIKRMSDTPVGRALAAKVIGAVSNLGEDLARVRVDNPAGVAKWDKIAVQDNINKSDTLTKLMKTKVEGAYDAMWNRRKTLFSKAYEEAEEVGSNLEYNPLEAISNINKTLTEDGYLIKGKLPNPRAVEDIVRDIAPAEQKVINNVVLTTRKVMDKASKGKSVGYDEMQAAIKSLDEAISAKDVLKDETLKSHLKRYRADLKSHLVSVMEAADPEAAAKYVATDAKFSQVKDLMDKLAPKMKDGRLDTFLKQIIKDDGSFNSGLLGEISDALGTADPTKDILEMHVASKSTNWFGGSGLKMLTSPKATAATVNAFSETKQAVKGAFGAVPYMDKALNTIKGMDAATRKLLYNNPEALNTIEKIIAGAKASEVNDTDKLLKQSGL